ncbi:MAG: hypothetical protein LUG50_09290 [Planctomycetaceae bacterium]|nr:hypothetical protein [Planctomycetaceae bacterium]
MDIATSEFVAAARAGRPVFITDVRNRYNALPPEQSFPLHIIVKTLDGGDRRLSLRLPRFIDTEATDHRFPIDFFLAEIYNILSSLGGRKIILVNPENAPEGEVLVKEFNDRFAVDVARSERTGHGKCLNVLERILGAPAGGKRGGCRKFKMELVAREPATEPAPTASAGGAADMFARAIQNMEGKTILGVDIGGTDIKLALARNGRLVRFKEFDWFPASFTAVEELIDPVVVLVRLMGLAAVADRDNNADLAKILEPAFSVKATVPEIIDIIGAAPAADGGAGFAFDAIGMCFPDVVVDNKIVGGEVFKTRGIRDALGADYDRAFARLTDLDTRLAPYVKPDGCVAIVNDGPMAAFTAGVEMAAKDPAAVANGVFAYTLGTELGTGWVTEQGAVPKIPLEVYNFIIDLGSWPEREYEPDDIRSINNFNTRIPGTLQKFACQSGVFRMAIRYSPERRPDLLARMREVGFVVEMDGYAGKGLYVPTGPRDMRKPFLEFMMGLVDSENDPDVNRIFKDIGVALAVTGEEIDWILAPAARERILFGRLVKNPSCFALMEKGAASRESAAALRVADNELAETPLIRDLRKHKDYTVAQFAQAVGAVYYGNYVLGTL